MKTEVHCGQRGSGGLADELGGNGLQSFKAGMEKPDFIVFLLGDGFA